MTGGERDRIPAAWNLTARLFPDDLCLHQLFERQVFARPDATALAGGGARVTYAELDRRAERLAGRLQALGLGPERLAGIACERTPGLVVAILGVLKAGAAYLPLDPATPDARLRAILEGGGAAVLVTDGCLGGRLADLPLPAIAPEAPGEAPAAGVAARVTPGNLAYVITTSGSTGVPKGIAIAHRGVVNNLVDLNERGGVGPDDRILALSSLGFDMSVYEVLGTLAAGGTIVLPEPESARDPEHWIDLVEAHGVTVWNSAPALLGMLVDALEAAGRRAPSLRLAILGGDWVPLTLPERLRALAPGVRVFVLGGATEASIHSTFFEVEERDPSWRSIPYGRPMANQTCHVLDAAGRPVPIGEPGELLLGGVGLARGYHGRPDLTADRFVPHPFPAVPGERLYRTGDLVRWRPDGTLELLGRLDHQVKVRGQRVELGEISAALDAQPEVERSVIGSRRDTVRGVELVAYVVPRRVAAADDAHESDEAGWGEAVDRWKDVYEETYGGPPPADPRSDFAGWVASDGRPFTRAELDEVLDGTLGRLRALAPRRVLEIGCGTGLVLLRLAPTCERYDATDVSETAVRSLTARCEALGLGHVRLERRAAHEVVADDGAYDLVVLSSVAQHFPSATYLARVLSLAVRATRDGGSVFVGDLRSLPLMRAFHLELEEARGGVAHDAAERLGRLAARGLKERELFVDPALFSDLARRLPRVGTAGVYPRRGRLENEISRYHYDAVLRVGPAPPSREVTWLGWEEAGGARGWRARLRPGAALGLRGVPNARLVERTAALERLSGAGAGVAALDGVEPEELWAEGESLGLEAEVSLSAGGADRLDVRFGPPAPGRGPGEPPLGTSTGVSGPGRAWSAYTNDPLASRRARRLASDLKSRLRERLPEAMVPAHVVVLDALPLSPNGKVDRRALPEPDLAGSDRDGAAPPVDALERVVASLWSEALGVEAIGSDSDFFDLGGHSLAATQIASRVRELLGLRVPLRALFENPVLSGYANAVATVGAAAGLEVRSVAAALLELAGRPALENADVPAPSESRT